MISQPVNLYLPTSMGVHDVYGNVWEWTEDHFNGLPGFKTNYLYDDYSTPSFDSRHTMIMVSMFNVDVVFHCSMYILNSSN